MRKNKEKTNAYMKNYMRRYIAKQRIEDPRKLLFKFSKARARTYNIEHSITLEDIIIPETCPVLGIVLEKSGVGGSSMSLDRIIPEIGYVPGNVKVISFRANRLKGNGTLEEFRKIVSYMEDKCQNS